MKKTGFTLIELLVTVSIIAIVTAIGLAAYFEIQKGARDSRRKQDLRSIQAALEIYYQKNNSYPCSDPNELGSAAATWQKSSDTENPWIHDNSLCTTPKDPIVFDTAYISSLPKDPKNTAGLPWEGSGGSHEYSYAYWSGQFKAGVSATSGCPKGKAQYYILAANLERANDPQGAVLKPYYSCLKDTDGNPLEIIDPTAGLIPSAADIQSLFFITSQD